jgi:hypothetical protein
MPWKNNKHYIFWVSERENVCVCVCVALLIQHFKCMSCIITIHGLSGSTIFFHVISYTAQFSEKLLNITCVFIFSTTFIWNISHLSLIQRDTVTNVCKSSCKVPPVLVTFYLNSSFLDRVSKQVQINLIKISTVGTELFHLDRWMDMHDEANSHFLQLWNVPKPLICSWNSLHFRKITNRRGVAT